MKFDICIGTYKRIPKLLRLLESIKAENNSNISRILIYVDNNDKDSYLTLKSNLLCEELKVEIVLLDKPYRIFGIWNKYLQDMSTDAVFMLGDDVEFINGGLVKSIKDFENTVKDTDGFMGIKAGDNLGGLCHPASFGIISRKFADRFPDRKCYCLDYVSHFGDPELCDFAKSIGKFFYTKETNLTHYKNEHTDEVFKSTGEARRDDKTIYTLRKEKGYLWGRNFELLSGKPKIMFPSTLYENSFSAQYKSLLYGLSRCKGVDVELSDKLAVKCISGIILFDINGKRCVYDYGDASRFLGNNYPNAPYFKTQCMKKHEEAGAYPIATAITNPIIFINCLNSLREIKEYDYDVIAIFRNSDLSGEGSRRQRCIELLKADKSIDSLCGLSKFRDFAEAPVELRIDKLSYEDYLFNLSKSKIGIGLPGRASTHLKGWCWRDMEILGMGKLLITLHSDLAKPGNFWDCCVTVKDDLSDLIEKVKYYISHNEEREKIAARGKAYFDKYVNPVSIAEYIIAMSKGA